MAVEFRTTGYAPSRNHSAVNSIKLLTAELHALGFSQIKKLLSGLACANLLLQLRGQIFELQIYYKLLLTCLSAYKAYRRKHIGAGFYKVFRHNANSGIMAYEDQ